MLHTNYCNYNFSNPDHDIINRPSGTPEYLFLYFQTPMNVMLDGITYCASAGACLLIPPNTRTWYQAVCHFTNSFVHFYGDEAAELVNACKNIPQNRLFYLPDVETVNRILKGIYTEYVSKDDLYEQQIDHLLHMLLILLSRQLSGTFHVQETSPDLYQAFQKARLTILTHPGHAWDVSSMAALTHLGGSQFYNYYKKFFHRSPKAKLLDVRLELAGDLLRHESCTVAATAECCGFSNPAHFTRCFKKRYGVAPGQYRRKTKSRV